MFCPTCGTEYSIELNYCNRCGANLSTALAPQSGSVPVNLTRPTLIIGVTVLLLTLGGFGGIISGVIGLTRAVGGGGGDLLMAIVFFGMLTILTVDILLMRQLSKLISASLSPNQLSPAKRPAQAQPDIRLPRPATARLEPAPSVTENTTRFFEPEYGSASELQRQSTAENLKN